MNKNVEYYTLEPVIGMKNSLCTTDNTPYISPEMRRRALEGGLFIKTHNYQHLELGWFDIKDTLNNNVYTVVNDFIQQAPQHLIVAARLKGEI